MSTSSSSNKSIKENNHSTEGNINNAAFRSNTKEEIDFGDLSNLLTGPEVDGSDDSRVNETIDQMNNDDEKNENYSKHNLLIEYKVATKCVGENDLHPEVRKQYTSANVTFLC